MTLTNRPPDSKGKTQLKEKKKKLKNKNRCGIYEALRRERFNEQLKKLQDVLAPEVVVKTKVEIVIAAQLFVRRCKSLHSPKSLSESANQKYDDCPETASGAPVKGAATEASEGNLAQGTAPNLSLASTCVPSTDVHSLENAYPLVELDQNCKINFNEVVGVTVLNNSNNLVPVQPNGENYISKIQGNKPISCLQLVNNGSILNEANQLGSRMPQSSMPALAPDTGQTYSLLPVAKPTIETQTNHALKNLVSSIHSEPVKIVLKEPSVSSLSANENQEIVSETSRQKAPKKIIRVLAPNVQSATVISSSNTKPLLTPRIVGTVQNGNVLSLVSTPCAPLLNDSQLKKSPRRLMKKPINHSVNAKNFQLILSPTKNDALSTSQIATSSTVAKIVQKCSSQVKLLAPRKAPDSQAILAFEPVQLVPNVRPETPIVVLCPSLKPPPLKLRNIAPKQSPSTSQSADQCETKNLNQMMPLITREQLLAEKKRTSCPAPSFRPEKRLKLSSSAVSKNSPIKNNDSELVGSKKSIISSPKSTVTVTPLSSSSEIVSYPPDGVISTDGCSSRSSHISGMPVSSLETSPSAATSSHLASHCSINTKADSVLCIMNSSITNSAIPVSSIAHSITRSATSELSSNERHNSLASYNASISCPISSCNSTIISSQSIDGKITCAANESSTLSLLNNSTSVSFSEALVIPSNIDHVCPSDYTSSANKHDDKFASLKPDHGGEVLVKDVDMPLQSTAAHSSSSIVEPSTSPVQSKSQVPSGLEIYSEINIPTVTSDILFSGRKCRNSSLSASLLPETHPILLPTSCHMTPVASIISSDPNNSSHSGSHCPSKTGSSGCCPIISSTTTSLQAVPNSAHVSCGTKIDFENKGCKLVCSPGSLSGRTSHQPHVSKSLSLPTDSACVSRLSIMSTPVIPVTNSFCAPDKLLNCQSVSVSSVDNFSQSKGTSHSVQSIFSSASSSSNYSITALCMSSKGKAMGNSNVQDTDKSTLSLNTSKFIASSVANSTFATELANLRDLSQTTSTSFSKVFEPCASVQAPRTSGGAPLKVEVTPYSDYHNSVLTSVQLSIVPTFNEKHSTTTIHCADKSVHGTICTLPQHKMTVATTNVPVEIKSCTSSVLPVITNFSSDTSGSSVFPPPTSIKNKPLVTNEKVRAVKTLSTSSVSTTTSCSFSSGLDTVAPITSASALSASESGVADSHPQISDSALVVNESNIATSWVDSSRSLAKGNKLNTVDSNNSNSSSSSLASVSSFTPAYANKSCSETKTHESIDISRVRSSSSTVKANGSSVITPLSGNSISISRSPASVKSTALLVSVLSEQISCLSTSSASSEKPSASIFPPILSSGPAPSFSPLQCLAPPISDSVSSSCFSAATPGADMNLAVDTSVSVSQSQTKFGSMYSPIVTTSGVQDRKMHGLHSSNPMYSNLMLNTAPNFTFLSPTSTGLGSSLRPALCVSSTLISSNSSIYSFPSSQNYSPNYATFVSLPLSHSTPTSFSFSLSSNPSSVTSDVVNTYSGSGHTHTGFGSSNSGENVHFSSFMTSTDGHQNYPVQSYHRYPIASSWDNCSSTESSSSLPSSFVVSFSDPYATVQNSSKPLYSVSSSSVQVSATNSSKIAASIASSSSTTDHFSNSLKAIIKKPPSSTCTLNSPHKTTDTLNSIVSPLRAPAVTSSSNQHSFVSTSLSSAGFFVPSTLYPVNNNKTKISTAVKEQFRDSSICSSQEENICTNESTAKSVFKETILPTGILGNSVELKTALPTSSTIQEIFPPEKETSTELLVSCTETGKSSNSSKVESHSLASHNCSSSSTGKAGEISHFPHSKIISESKTKGTYPPVESLHSSTSLTVSASSTPMSLSGVSYPTTDRAVNATSTFLPPSLSFFTPGVDLSLENSSVSYYHPVSCSTNSSETPVPVSKNSSISTQPSMLSTLGTDPLCFHPLSTPLAGNHKIQTSDISYGSIPQASVSSSRSPSTASSPYGSIACMTSSRGAPWTPQHNPATSNAIESTKIFAESSTSIAISRSDPCFTSHPVAPVLVGSKGHESYLDYPTSCSSSGLQQSLCFIKPSCAAESAKVTTAQAMSSFSSNENKTNDKLISKCTEVKANVGRMSSTSIHKELKKVSHSSEVLDPKAGNKQSSLPSMVTHQTESSTTFLRNSNASNPVHSNASDNPGICNTTNSVECKNVSVMNESVKLGSSSQDVTVDHNMSTLVSTSESNYCKQPTGSQLFSPEDQSDKSKVNLNASRTFYYDSGQQKSGNSDLSIENTKICQVNTACNKSVSIPQSPRLVNTNKSLNELFTKPETSLPISANHNSSGELSAQVLTVTNPSTEIDTSTTLSTGQRPIIGGNKSHDPVLLNGNKKSILDKPTEETSSIISKPSTVEKTLKTRDQPVTHDQNLVRPQQPTQLSQQMQTPVHASQNGNFQHNLLQQQQKGLLHQQSLMQKQSHDLETQQLQQQQQQQQQHQMNLQLPGPSMQHHHAHHVHNTQQQTHQTHQHHQQHQHQHLMGSNLYSPSTFDYSGSIYNRRHPTSPRGDTRQCYAPSAYNKDQQLQHYQLDDHNPLNDLSGVNNYILDDGADERETLADPVRYFSVSHLVSQNTTTRKQPTNLPTKSDEKKTEKGSKQVGGKKNESKSRGKTVTTSDGRRRSPARSQVSVQQAAMWHSSKQSAGQSKTPNYSTEALLSSQNYMRTAAAVPPQPINQNYPIMTQNVYQYSHQMKNFPQNSAVPFGYSSATNNVDACTPDYNFQLHQTAGPLGYASNMPYMTPTYPYQTSSSSGMLPSDIMAASHPPPPPPPPYPRFHEFPPDQNSFPPNPTFPFAFDTQDMCGGSNGAVGNPQYTGTMLDNSTIIGGSSTSSTSHRTGPCVPFSPLRMMDRQQGAVVANMMPAAQLSSSLSNFNLTSIIPEIDNKVGGDNSSLLSTSRSGVAAAAASSSRPSAAPPADPAYALKLPQLDHAATNKAQFHANSMNNFFPSHAQVGFGLNTASLPLPTSSFSCLNFPPPEHS